MKIRREILLLAAFAIPALGQTPPVTITTPLTLPTGYAGIYYGAPQISGLQFTATTNPSPVTITWTSGALPQGLTLTTSGFLSGTPASAGNYQFMVRATTQYGTDSRNFSLTVVNPQLTVTTQSIPNGSVGQNYSTNFTAFASPPIGVNWSVDPASLPPGLNFFTSNSQGILAGIPTTPGTYDFPVTASFANTNISTTVPFTIAIFAGQVVLTTTSLTPAPVGQPYLSAALTANPAGATFSVLPSSTLPPGISFDSANHRFTGLPTTVGAYQILVQADYPGYNSASKVLTLYVTNGPLRILETSIPVAIQNAAYRTTLTPVGGFGPFQWSLNGNNGAGMSIDSKLGTISGTPPALGTFSLQVTLSDAAGETFSEALSLVVATPLTILTTSLPAGSVGVAYNQALQAGGGQAPFTWALVQNSGSLPPGLQVSTSGVISGTPTANGIYNFTIQATDFGARVATKALSITIGAGNALSITTLSLPDGSVNVAYSATLAASGGTAPYLWSIPTGSLPAGLSLDTRTGAITGTPTTLGTSTFTVQVNDSTFGTVPLSAQKSFTINIAVPLVISTTSLSNAAVGTAYSATLQATGGKQPYTWSLASGSLPAGLQLNANTGEISGTPAASGAGTALIIVVVTDSNGQSARQQLSLTVTAPSNPVTFGGGSFTATTGVAFSQTLTASGGTTPYSFALTAGSLPAGITLNGSGALSGTPTTAGSSSATVTVTDAARQTASATVSITVSAPATPPVTVSLGSGSPAPAQQAPVSASLGNPLPQDATGTLTVSFASSVGGSDSTVQFITPAGRTNTVNFTVPRGTTQVTFPSSVVLATGTTAGTITVTPAITVGGAPLSPAPSPTTFTINPSAPVLQTVTMTASGNTLTVVITGYTNTHEATNAEFVFAGATGANIGQNDVVVPAGTAFTAYFQSAGSSQFGGQFKATFPFTIANGTAAQLVSVRATLANARGVSAAITP